MVDALLVSGARVLAPEDLGTADVLAVAGRVVAVEPELGRLPIAEEHVRRVDGGGSLLLPALVDQHCHPTGGGGWGGWRTQNPPIPLDDFLVAGIGTLAGVLGHDTSVRRPEALLARVRGLGEQGVRAAMLTGEIGYPPATLTGSILRDLALIPEVLGVKAAVGEGGAAITDGRELAGLAREAVRGSRTAGKRCNLHLHLGTGAHRLEPVQAALDGGDLDPGTLSLTHVNWDEPLLAGTAELAARGVNLDVTACIRPGYFPGTVDPADALGLLLERGVAPERLTVSSDSGGCHAGPDGALVPHDPVLLLEVLRDAARAGTVPLPELVACFTRNPADRLGLARKGRLEPGADADLLLVDEGFALRSLLLGGREFARDGAPVVHDAFHANPGVPHA